MRPEGLPLPKEKLQIPMHFQCESNDIYFHTFVELKNASGVVKPLL